MPNGPEPDYRYQWFTDGKCTAGSEYGQDKGIDLISEPDDRKVEIETFWRNQTNKVRLDRDLLESLDGYSIQMKDNEVPLGCCKVIVHDQDCTDPSEPGCTRRMLEDMFDQI